MLGAAIACVPAAGCGGDSPPAIDAPLAPDGAAGDDAPAGDDAAIDGAMIDAAMSDATDDAASIDAAMTDGATIDATGIDGAVIDAATIDAATIDAAMIDAAMIDAAMIDAAMIDGAPTDAPATDAADDAPIDAPVAPVIATFTATPSYVRAGALAFVRWDWTYASPPAPTPTCTIDQGVGLVTSGQVTGINLSADRTYTLTCTSSAGSDARAVTVHVAIPPVIAGFTATPSSLAYNAATLVTWSFTFANAPAPAPTCSIEHGVGAVVSGQMSSITLAHARVYRLTCSNVGGVATAETTIAVGECAAGVAACDAHATCTDTTESYTCTCNAGYTGDGRTCSALAACDVMPSVCDPAATCTTTPSGPACVCDPGYVGTGTTCTRLPIAFTTSTSGTAMLSSWPDAGGATGVAAADAICQARATAGGLPGTYVAWLSSSTADAYCRVHGLAGTKAQRCGQATLPATAGPWVRPDGQPFAPRIDRLLAPNQVAYYPASLDERGAALPPGVVWSATSASGVFSPVFATTAPPCADWTVADTTKATVGRIQAGGTAWTEGKADQTCATAARLRCLEVASGPALPARAPVGKRVFLTSTTGNGQLASWSEAGGATGLAAADAVCQARARAAGIATWASWKAWMSVNGVAATSRITSSGPWSRLDGTVIATSRADLLDGQLAAAMSETEAGAYLFGTNTFSFESAWTGTDEAGQPYTYDCSAWQVGASGTFGGGGYFDLLDLNWTKAFFGSCNALRHLYCVED